VGSEGGSACASATASVGGVSEAKAEFVQSKSYPDHTCVPCRQTLVKTWEVKNSGLSAWPEKTKLYYVKGTLPSTENEYEVPNRVEPGQSVEISALVQTPQCHGRYRAMFRLGVSKDEHFGPKLWCDLSVVDAEADHQMGVNEESETQKVDQLVGMGFVDLERNRELLKEHNGDVERVCLVLLEKMK